LGELNDGVEGKADVRSLEEVLAKDKEWLSDFTIVIAHNLEAVLLDQLASFLWEDSSNPPLVIVRSAGFLAEVYIQYHEHAGMYAVYYLIPPVQLTRCSCRKPPRDDSVSPDR